MKPFHKNLKILTLGNQIFYNNVLFIYDSLNKKVNPNIFHNFFKKCNEVHNYQTRGALTDQLAVPKVSHAFGLKSVFYKMVSNWNQFLKNSFRNQSSLDISRTKFIETLKIY